MTPLKPHNPLNWAKQSSELFHNKDIETLWRDENVSDPSAIMKVSHCACKRLKIMAELVSVRSGGKKSLRCESNASKWSPGSSIFSFFPESPPPALHTTTYWKKRHLNRVHWVVAMRYHYKIYKVFVFALLV
jgi:hypothetical protein